MLKAHDYVLPYVYMALNGQFLNARPIIWSRDAEVRELQKSTYNVKNYFEDSLDPVNSEKHILAM